MSVEVNIYIAAGPIYKLLRKKLPRWERERSINFLQAIGRSGRRIMSRKVPVGQFAPQPSAPGQQHLKDSIDVDVFVGESKYVQLSINRMKAPHWYFVWKGTNPSYGRYVPAIGAGKTWYRGTITYTTPGKRISRAPEKVKNKDAFIGIHPGIKPNPYIEETMKEWFPEIKKEFNELLRSYSGEYD